MDRNQRWTSAKVVRRRVAADVVSLCKRWYCHEGRGVGAEGEGSLGEQKAGKEI